MLGIRKNYNLRPTSLAARGNGSLTIHVSFSREHAEHGIWRELFQGVVWGFSGTAQAVRLCVNANRPKGLRPSASIKRRICST
jgi:hypothetical protein